MAAVEGCAYCKTLKKGLTKEHVKILLKHPIGCDLSFHVNVCAACRKKLANEGIEHVRGSLLVLVA